MCGDSSVRNGSFGPINWRHNRAGNNARSSVTRSRDVECGGRIFYVNEDLSGGSTDQPVVHMVCCLSARTVRGAWTRRP